MNRIALGTVQFGLDYGIANQGGRISNLEMEAILEYARANDVSMLDTASAYGASEERLGQFGVQDWQIISKLPVRPETMRDIEQWVKESLFNSLNCLKVKSLYGFLLHRPSDLFEHDGDKLYRALYNLKRDGLVKKIGISIYEPAELDLIWPKYQFDIVQAPFNLLDRRLFESGWLTRLTDSGVEAHARSVFLQGLLLMNPSERRKRFGSWIPLWSQLDDWLENSKLSALQACLRYVWSFSQIDKILVGIDSSSQLKGILAAIKGPAPQVPCELYTDDVHLLNPAHWGAR